MVLCLVTSTDLLTGRAGLSASAELLVFNNVAADARNIWRIKRERHSSPSGLSVGLGDPAGKNFTWADGHWQFIVGLHMLINMYDITNSVNARLIFRSPNGQKCVSGRRWGADSAPQIP